ncbi:MAG TPA: class I SAM-dependent methyltransferase [bacterium]|nr:class I SAM-dependent methyltransferase [bacterium]
MLIRGREQCLARQSAAGRLYYRWCGVPDLGLQLRSRHAWRALCRLSPPARLLDYGCGSGRFALFLARHWPQCAITGYEPDPATLAAARERQAAAGYTNLAFTGSCPDGPYDCILLLDVLAHVDDPEQLGQALATRLRPGGALVLHTPSGAARAHFARHRDFDSRQTDRTRPAWPPEELGTWLARHGFSSWQGTPTFRRFAGGLAWELDQCTTIPWLTPCWHLLTGLDAFMPAAGGGLLVVARRSGT